MLSITRRVLLVAASLAFISSPLLSQTEPDGPWPKRQRAQLAFVANQSDNNLSAFLVKSSGALQPLSGFVPAGGSPNSVTVVPSGRFAYVADVIPGGISGFSLAHNGTLTALPGSPFAAPTGTAFVTTDPSGRFLYALNCGANCSGSGPGNLSAYSINQKTGALSPVPGSPFPTGQYPYSLATDPAGQFAYVANAGSGDVYAYSIDSQTGALTQIGSPIAAGTRPLSIAVDPWDQYVYTANTGSGDVSGFVVNFDGTLRATLSPPVAVGDFTASIAISHNGKYVLVAAGAGAYVYDLDNNGALHLMPGSPYSAGSFPNGVAIDANDLYVYVVNRGSNDVNSYRFNDMTGKLTQLKGGRVNAGQFATAITAVPAPH